MHAFSRDGQTWTRSKVFPFDAAVNFSDGTSTEMKRRERPELLLSKRRKVLLLLCRPQSNADDEKWLQKFHLRWKIHSPIGYEKLEGRLGA